jgi:hypothetical protein
MNAAAGGGGPGRYQFFYSIIGPFLGEYLAAGVRSRWDFGIRFKQKTAQETIR